MTTNLAFFKSLPRLSFEQGDVPISECSAVCLTGPNHGHLKQDSDSDDPQTSEPTPPEAPPVPALLLVILAARLQHLLLIPQDGLHALLKHLAGKLLTGSMTNLSAVRDL